MDAGNSSQASEASLCDGGKTWSTKIFENMREEYIEDLLQKDGDFLIRKPMALGSLHISVKWRSHVKSFLPYYDGKNYGFGEQMFESFEKLVYYHSTKGVPLGGGSKAVLMKLILPIPTKMIERNKAIVQKALNSSSSHSHDKSFQVKMGDGIVAYQKILSKLLPINREMLLAEIQYISSMSHRNVASCYGLVEDDKQRIVLLSEWVSGGCIRDHLKSKKYNEKEKCHILFDGASGLQFLHRHQIVHRNVSTSEVFVCTSKTSIEKIYKLSGIEWYKINVLNKVKANINEERLPPSVYMAPESMTKKVFSRQSDIWCFGVFIWEVLSNGAVPYSDLKSNDKLEEFVQKGGRLKPPDNIHVRKELKDLMDKCWHHDPNARPFIVDIVAILDEIKRSMADKL